MMSTHPIRHDWQLDQVMDLFDHTLNDLIFKAHTLHRQYFDANQIHLSTLLNIKTGACPEDCAYCPQSAHFKTAVTPQPLMTATTVVAAAQQAKAQGSTRFCMGAAWRQPKAQDFEKILPIIAAVKAIGVETCASFGLLTATQAQQLKTAGLDYYNHNLDTSAAYYDHIINTRTYQDRLETLQHVRAAGIKVCCGGIIGMGEALTDRAQLLMTLANLPQHPESVPINLLVPVAGTPLAETDSLDPFDLVRCVAVARILMPASYVRLSAGRAMMNDELQALCFLAGANAVFYGEQLLTTPNALPTQDQILFQRLGLRVI